MIPSQVGKSNGPLSVFSFDYDQIADLNHLLWYFYFLYVSLMALNRYFWTFLYEYLPFSDDLLQCGQLLLKDH